MTQSHSACTRTQISCLLPSWPQAKLDDMSAMAFAGRYIILLMSLYSIFTGALYNEFFSIPMTLAGDTRFKWAWEEEGERRAGRGQSVWRRHLHRK